MTSSRVFITNGPIQATGSRIGRPPRMMHLEVRVRLSWIGDAPTVMAFPSPNSASWPVPIGLPSAPTVPCPART